jgi:hypothetical protein
MSRNSAFRYRQPDLKPNRVANELGVGALLMGAVQQHGDEVRASVELVDGKDEHQTWGEEYTRSFSDLSGIQADIAQQISQRLRIAGSALSRVARHDTDNSEAYRLYLRGKFALETRKNSDALTAVRYFEQAAHLDRNYALAYSGMAHNYALLAFYGGLAVSADLKGSHCGRFGCEPEMSAMMAGDTSSLTAVRNKQSWFRDFSPRAKVSSWALLPRRPLEA